MADAVPPGAVLDALLQELSAQGQGPFSGEDHQALSALTLSGPIDLLALAEAVEDALGGSDLNEQEAKSPAELNAANDG